MRSYALVLAILPALALGARPRRPRAGPPPAIRPELLGPHPARATRAGDPGERILRYAVVTAGRPSGEGEVRIAADGTRRTHFAFNDRGRGPDVRTELRTDAAGAPRFLPRDRAARTRGSPSTSGSTSAAASSPGAPPASAGRPPPAPGSTSRTTTPSARRSCARCSAPPAGGSASCPRARRGSRRTPRSSSTGAACARSRSPASTSRRGSTGSTRTASCSRCRRRGSRSSAPAREALIPRLVAADQSVARRARRRLAAQLAHRPPAAGLAIRTRGCSTPSGARSSPTVR